MRDMICVDQIIRENKYNLLGLRNKLDDWLRTASPEDRRALIATDETGRTVLHYLSCQSTSGGHLVGLKWLLDQREQLPIDLNVRDQQSGRTALSYAVSVRNSAAVSLLLRAGSDPNPPDKNGHTPLLYPFIMQIHNPQNRPIIRELMKYGANPYVGGGMKMDKASIFHRAAGIGSPYMGELFAETSSSGPFLREILEKPVDSLVPVLCQFLPRLSKKGSTQNNLINTLSFCALNRANRREFREAEAIFHKVIELCKARRESRESVCVGKDPFAVSDEQFTFSDDFGSSLEKRDNAREDLRAIAHLFRNQDVCLRLLQSLDAEIQSHQSCLDIDFSTISPHDAAPLEFMEDLRLPPAPEKDKDYSSQKTYRLLFHLLGRTFSRHGIQHNIINIPLGFYPNIADFTNAGALFKESRFSGTGLVHGSYSHDLQWYILCRAVEEKEVSLTCSPGECLKIIRKVSIQGSDAWTQIFDLFYSASVEKNNDAFYIGDPLRLNCFLLNAQRFPHLRGLLRTLFYKDVQKITAHAQNTSEESIPYVALLGGTATSGYIFGRFHQYPMTSGEEMASDEEVCQYAARYYQTRPESTESATVITKNLVTKTETAFWANCPLC